MKIKVKLRGKLRAGFCLQRLDAERVSVMSLDRKATVVLLGQIIDRNEGAIQDKIYDIANNAANDEFGTRVSALESTATDHESRIAALEAVDVAGLIAAAITAADIPGQIATAIAAIPSTTLDTCDGPVEVLIP